LFGSVQRRPRRGGLERHRFQRFAAVIGHIVEQQTGRYSVCRGADARQHAKALNMARSERIGAPILAVFLVLAAVTSAAAQTNLQRVQASGLPKQEGAITLYASRSAQREAAIYGAEMAAAADWYRAQLGWDGHLTIAVLDKADFGRITQIPYPSPHAETLTGLIIIADHIVEHPGFDRWDLDEVGLNCAWSFHEIGHVIARDLGISSPNAWINELAASIFMAAYVRAQRPQFAGFQSGMPARFTSTGRYSKLAEFDALYFDIGQWDYLWYHFHIARIA